MTVGPVTSFGFRIKSGYAVAVLLAGSRQAPSAVGRRVVELCDPDAVETRQPFHGGFGKEEGDPQEIARRVEIVRQSAMRAIAVLMRETSGGEQDGRRRPGRNGGPQAGLVVGSLIDPQQVGNPHIRAHASEGRLFRTVVEEGLRAHGISCTVFLERELAVTAAHALCRNDGSIKQAVAGFGKAIGGPWRADEKTAAIAAWLVMPPTPV
jgi:hypothetical protein